MSNNEFNLKYTASKRTLEASDILNQYTPITKSYDFNKLKFDLIKLNHGNTKNIE